MRYFMPIFCILFFIFCKQENKPKDVYEVEYYDPVPIADSLNVLESCGWATECEQGLAIIFSQKKRSPYIYLDSLAFKKGWNKSYLNKRICVKGILVYRNAMNIKKWHVVKNGKDIPQPSTQVGSFPHIIHYTWYVEN
jgi:hypothetical protein